MTKARSIKGVARSAKAADSKLRKALNKKGATPVLGSLGAPTADSFVNFAQNMGIGAANPLTTAGYGFNPITRIRTMLEWIHRGSWLGGVAVDVVADDMTKAGVELKGEVDPQDIKEIQELAVALRIWPNINATIKWDRLYGGCLAVLLIDGQDPSTPLIMDRIGKDQFKGLMVLDRWMVDPSLSNLVTEYGPELGLPKYYNVVADAPALPRMRIHHSRCIRLGGVELPYWQRVMENLWGTSVLERLYDRMIAYDSATTGAAQLVYKAYIRTYKIEGMRDIIAQGGPALAGMVKYMEMMRNFQGIEGVTLMDLKDEFEGKETGSFQGLSDALTQFGQQLAGALQIPLVRLFGQSPSGFNSGDNELRMYYDTIKQHQEKALKVGVTRIYRAIAQSLGKTLPEGFTIEFKSLWQLTEKDKADVANVTVDAVTKAQEAGLISDQVAMKELKQSSEVSGVFSNITQEDIDAADDVPAPPLAETMLGAGPGGEEGSVPGATGAPKLPTAVGHPALPKHVTPAKAAADSISAVAFLKHHHDLDVVIESPYGTRRKGDDWDVVMPYDYGYFAGTKGADGEGVDCCIGKQHDSQKAWIVNQNKHDTGKFDEHKVMVGYGTKREALGAYLNGYRDGNAWDRIGGIHEVDVATLKDWLKGDCSKPYLTGV